jgi:ribosome recycling factor
MAIEEIKRSAEQRMNKTVETLKTDLTKVRTGRAHTGLLDHIHVDYYGTSMPINQVANVTLADARTITVQPWEKKMVQAVEKAIRDSDIGVNPATQGDVIRIPMPAMTEERRRDLTKVVRHEAENARVAVRNVRRDAIEHLKKMEKQEHFSEDDRKRAEETVQKMTDKYVKEMDALVVTKEKEVMEV